MSGVGLDDELVAPVARHRRPTPYRGRRRANRGSNGRTNCGAATPTRRVGITPAWWAAAGVLGVVASAAVMVGVVGLAVALAVPLVTR